jgi:hypothetical protein
VWRIVILTAGKKLMANAAKYTTIATRRNSMLTPHPFHAIVCPRHSREGNRMQPRSHSFFFSFYYFYAGRKKDWLLRVE